MVELNDFYNLGFGWVCRQCEIEFRRESDSSSPSRLMTEGEAESKQPVFSNREIAKWADAAQTILVCPGCGITEEVSKF